MRGARIVCYVETQCVSPRRFSALITYPRCTHPLMEEKTRFFYTPRRDFSWPRPIIFESYTLVTLNASTELNIQDLQIVSYLFVFFFCFQAEFLPASKNMMKFPTALQIAFAFVGFVMVSRVHCYEEVRFFEACCILLLGLDNIKIRAVSPSAQSGE